MQKNLAKVHSAELEGIAAKPIEVEVDLNVGLHSFTIVGLADKALNEAKERVNSALKNSGVKPPNRENRKITVNLAPADIKKTGSQYDLAIAIGYLLSSQQMKPCDTSGMIFVGELALDGHLRPINGALNIAEMARERGFSTLFVPRENADEAAVIREVRVIPADTLQDVIDVLEGARTISRALPRKKGSAEPPLHDFSHIRGQAHAKRALTIAAAGGHNVLMIGPPGVGKSFLAQAMSGILPALAHEEAIEITKIWSAAGLAPQGLLAERPFRAPHHTASVVSIVGGGTNPKPGEISLAHRGILFLDELPEFPRSLLEALRGPLESGNVHVARAKGTLSFPARFTLVAAMNPCPCGFHGDPEKNCRCSAYEVIRYQKRISGPLLDRIDLQVRVPRVEIKELREKKGGDERESMKLRKEIERARAVQWQRFAQSHGKRRMHTNAEMSSHDTEAHAALTPEAEQFIGTLEAHRLSPRAYYRIVKTARTIADLEGAARVDAPHLAEAFSYRLREEV